MIIPLAVQWWSTWYPGAEPGGGGYIAQRMLAAKDEKNATWAVLFFNFAHYALRPWPWIIVGLASLIIFPSLESLQVAFPKLAQSYIGHDLAYSAMLTFLPVGLLGLVATSLIAAFMSTLSTQLNWGASYIVNDVYKRFINKTSTPRQDINVGRGSTAILMVFAGLLSLVYENAKEVFDLMLLIGAGTGLLFILRWFWTKINPYSEIAAMAISFSLAIFFFINSKLDEPYLELSGNEKLLWSIFITTIGWIFITLITNPETDKVIDKFEALVFTNKDGEVTKFENFGFKILGFISATIGVYATLFAIGNTIYGETFLALVCFGIFAVCLAILISIRKKIV